MFFLNLSLPEFLAILGSFSGVTVALYLLDRMRKKHTVASLRFFTASEQPPVMKHRRKLQQPWSLLLQLLSLILLLLAIAQLRWGSAARAVRDHVVILDASAWMNARSGQGRLIDQVRRAARDYVKLAPANDRIMIVRAGVLATPATLFESDRAKIQRAIDQTQPGGATFNLAETLEFAQQAQRIRSQNPGEIVLIGTERISSSEALPIATPGNLRVIQIAGPSEHVGLRKVAVRRSLNDPDVWQLSIAVKNYGTVPRVAPLGVQFGGAAIGTKRFSLSPGAEENAEFRFKTRASGWLEARLLVQDAFPDDDRAVLELPARRLLPVTVYSSEPELLRPVFTAISGVQPEFRKPADYDPKLRSGIALFDRFAPQSAPVVDSIWIAPPAGKSPIAVKTSEKLVKLKQWIADDPLGAGLHTKDLEFENAEVFRLDRGDVAVAESNSGALIAARAGKPKTVVFGFHPVRSGMKYELATPLLFANILRWMAPDIFRTWELSAGTVGTVDVDLESEDDPSRIRVQTEDGRAVPFTVEGHQLRFFAGDPGIVRVITGDRERVYSMTLPQPGDVVWKPASAKIGLPRRGPAEPSSRDLWQWLAIAGAIGLAADWILYGRKRRSTPVSAATSSLPWRKAS